MARCQNYLSESATRYSVPFVLTSEHCNRTARAHLPSHTAQNTTAYLRHENVAFSEPDMWPATARINILCLWIMQFGRPCGSKSPMAGSSTLLISTVEGSNDRAGAARTATALVNGNVVCSVP